MKNNAAVAYALILIVGDFVAVTLAFVAAYIIRFEVIDPGLVSPIPGRTYAYAIIGTVPLWIIIHALIGLYASSVYERRFVELGRLLIGSVLGVMAALSYDFFDVTIELFPARLVPLYGFLLTFSFLAIFRGLARWIRRNLFRYGVGVSNVLVVGDNNKTEHVISALSNTAHTGQRVVGTVGFKIRGIPSYDSFESAVETSKDAIHSIIQTELFSSAAKNNQILLYAQQNHTAYRFVPGNSDLFVGDITVELFSGIPMIAVSQTSLTGWGRIYKRLFDILFSTATLIIASPILLLTALLIKITDPKGPVLFRQTRLTRFNNEFQVLKFRSMKQDFSGMSPEEAFKAMGKSGLIKKYRDNGDFLPNDPRVTAIGRFLRITSLDELPQLVNVLRGELSLVGPRALVPEELSAYAKRHAILSVKSGITGLAQISGRRDINFDERRRLDIYYVQNWSFWLDISILFRTIRAVLAGIGAK